MERSFSPRPLTSALISCISACNSSNRLSSLLPRSSRRSWSRWLMGPSQPQPPRPQALGESTASEEGEGLFDGTHHQRPRVAFPNTAAFMGNPPGRWIDLLQTMNHLVGNIPHKPRRRGVLPDKIHHNSGKHRHNSQALFPHVGVDGCGDADIGNQAQRANHQELDQANK